MKKIILLLIIFICISEVKAYDVTSEFYYDDEKVAGMWITREKDSVVMSGLPFFLKRKSDDAVVYCLEPFSMLKQEDGYKGYYENNSYFNLTDEQLEKIRLISYFGYMYPGHEESKLYGITQYLIWKVVEPSADIYFTKERYGVREDLYINEIKEIDNLIDSYNDFIKYDNGYFKFYSLDEFEKFRSLNIFFKDVDLSSKTITVPFNSNMKEREILFYHSDGQNLYMPSSLLDNEISIKLEFSKNILLKKYYGSGKYRSEKGAVFDLYRDNEFIQEVKTDKNGECALDLSYGNYKLVQKAGKKGYSFIDDYEFVVNDDTVNIIELYNEAIVVEVPDTLVLGTLYDFIRINFRKFRALKVY